jgi:hypothetical protein
MNRVGDCEAFQNVAAIEISPDGKLWVADSGTASVFAKPLRKCTAKLVVFDLNWDGGVVEAIYR